MKKLLWPFIAVMIAATTMFVTAAKIKSNHKFEVRHSDKVEQTVDPVTQQYVAGSPETYHINISPALAWEKSMGYSKVWRICGLVCLIAAGLFIVIAIANVWDGFPVARIVFVLAALAFAMFLAAYNSAFVSNFKEVSKEVFDLLNGQYEGLFDKPLIR